MSLFISQLVFIVVQREPIQNPESSCRQRSDGGGEKKDLDERYDLQSREVGEDGLRCVRQRKDKSDNSLTIRFNIDIKSLIKYPQRTGEQQDDPRFPPCPFGFTGGGLNLGT